MDIRNKFILLINQALGLLLTGFNYPDIWTKTVVNSKHDSILIIPRERQLTRISSEVGGSAVSQELAQKNAKTVLSPFRIIWQSVGWVGMHKVGQRIATHFSDMVCVFLAGDAAHTHSPKTSQGLNVSMHDKRQSGVEVGMRTPRISKTSSEKLR
ncbi:hypothetical protein KL927_004708 [Ogataea polymorpha]|nr:hypothetical protein KL927_004708 [Ogataea polymorpha]